MPFMQPHIAYKTPPPLTLAGTHTSPCLDFPAAETLQIQLYCAASKPEEEAAASPSWTGYGAPVPQGLWPQGCQALAQL